MYEDLVSLDERTQVQTVAFDKVEFSTHEAEEGERLFAKFGDVEIQVKHDPKQFETLCGAFGVPFLFAEQMPQDILGDIFRVRGQQSSDTVYNWAIDAENDEIIAYGEAKKPYIPFSRVGNVLQSVGMTDLDGNLGRNGIAEITGIHPTNGLIQPRVGDITKSGINVHMNPMNAKPPEVAPWSYRLVCLNGMTSLRERERIKVVGHDVDDVLEQIEYEAQRQFDFAQRLNHRFADMIGHQVDPVDAMSNLLNSQRIPTRMHQNLLDEASHLEDPYNTMYDVMNIFTRFASGHFDPIRRFELQRIGGEATLSDHLNCSRCGTQLD